MTDKLDKKTRSYIMSRVKGTNTRPEIIVKKLIHSIGLRYRNKKYDLPGTPDIVLPKYRCAIFVNGCFWHQHKKCGSNVLPKSNKKYWKNKLHGNIKRDKVNLHVLKRLNWKPIVVWECELKNIAKLQKRLTTLLLEMKSELLKLI